MKRLIAILMIFSVGACKFPAEENPCKEVHSSLSSCKTELTKTQGSLTQTKDLHKAEVDSLCRKGQKALDDMMTDVFVLKKGEEVLACGSEDVQVSLTSVTSDSAFLKVTRPGKVYYSDRLVWKGSKNARSAIYLREVSTFGTFLNVENCTKNACELTCTKKVGSAPVLCPNP